MNRSVSGDQELWTTDLARDLVRVKRWLFRREMLPYHCNPQMGEVVVGCWMFSPALYINIYTFFLPSFVLTFSVGPTPFLPSPFNPVPKVLSTPQVFRNWVSPVHFPLRCPNPGPCSTFPGYRPQDPKKTTIPHVKSGLCSVRIHPFSPRQTLSSDPLVFWRRYFSCQHLTPQIAVRPLPTSADSARQKVRLKYSNKSLKNGHCSFQDFFWGGLILQHRSFVWRACCCMCRYRGSIRTTKALIVVSVSLLCSSLICRFDGESSIILNLKTQSLLHRNVQCILDNEEPFWHPSIAAKCRKQITEIQRKWERYMYISVCITCTNPLFNCLPLLMDHIIYYIELGSWIVLLQNKNRNETKYLLEDVVEFILKICTVVRNSE